MAIDASGQLFLASMGRSSEPAYRVSVARFDGAARQPMGGPLGTGTFDHDYAMALDPGGAPIVVISEAVPTEMHSVLFLFVYRWNGATWVPSASPTAGYPPDVSGGSPLLATDGSGRLVAAWIRAAGLEQPSFSLVVARTRL